MTRKAHDVDRQATEAKQFLDKRSYVMMSRHEYLFGKDASRTRGIIFFRDKGICQACQKFCGYDGEMDHIKGGNTDDRCWCEHNLQWLCRMCHRTKHVHPKFFNKSA